MMKIRTLATVLASLLFVHGSIAEADEAEIVNQWIQRIESEPATYIPVSDSVMHERRAWLQRTVDRLNRYIADPRDGIIDLIQHDVTDWREKFRVDELNRIVRQTNPDPATLLDIYRAYEVNQIDLESIDGQDRDKTFHVVASVGRALYAYALLLKDTDRSTAEQNTKTSFGKLTALLGKYAAELKKENRDPVALAKMIHRVHDEVVKLQTRRQAADLAADLKAHYLRPKARLFISTDVLNEVVQDIQLPPQQVSDYQDQTSICGWATLGCPIRIETYDSNDMASLAGVYRGPVIFRGTARRNRIQLGITSSAYVNLTKEFRVIQHASDSRLADGSARLIATTSSGGKLVDRLVNRAAHKGFSSDRAIAGPTALVDRAVTSAANYINLQLFDRLENAFQGDQVLRIRQYRTRPTGIELTIESASGGFQLPPERRPPEPFELPTTPRTWLAVHRSAPRVLIKDLLNGDLDALKQGLLEFLEFSQQPGTTDTKLTIVEPNEGTSWVTFHGAIGSKTARLHFIARHKEYAGDFPAFIEFRPATPDEKFAIVVDREGEEAEAVKKLLIDKLSFLLTIDRIKLPLLDGKFVVEGGKDRKIRVEMGIEGEYLVFVGSSVDK